MKAFAPLIFFALGSVQEDHPRRYLLSIGSIPLKDSESIEAFQLETWGVEFRSVCRIPGGWRIKAGSSATPHGELSGEGSQGATWFNQGTPKELQGLVLVTLYGPVQQKDIGSPDNGIPATFKGSATISTDDGDVQRALTYKNIILTPAQRCREL
jgi:hypothetical protein